MSLLATVALSAALLQADEPPREPYRPVAYAEAPDDGVVTLELSNEESRAAALADDPYRSRYAGRGLFAGGERRKIGFRIEARTGWDQITLGAEGDDDRSDGLLYGLGVGYDRQFGRLFAGVFAGIDSTTAETSGVVSTSPDPLSGTVYETAFKTAAREDIEVGARLGWWLTKDWNVYSSVAWNRLNVDVDSQTVAISPVIGGGTVVSDPFIEDLDVTADGWRIGAGTEANLTDALYAKAEYRQTFYDEDDAGADTERYQLITGIGLRF